VGLKVAQSGRPSLGVEMNHCLHHRLIREWRYRFQRFRRGIRRVAEARLDPWLAKIAGRWPVSLAPLHALQALWRLDHSARYVALRPTIHRVLTPPGRSLLLLHNSYYHHLFMARALRKRGWDALAVSLESSGSPNARFYWGEDINLFDPDPERMRARLTQFYASIPSRFRMLHYAGDGLNGVFPENWTAKHLGLKPAWDFLELKRRGLRISYGVSGCADGMPQSSVESFTGGLCRKCIWQLHPEVCSDRINEVSRRQLELVADMVLLENDWVFPERAGPRFVKEPILYCLDPEIWRPDLQIPDAFRRPRAEGEFVVYHAVGNYDLRRRAGRDIKGTGAVLAAVDQLKAEGWKVRLDFVHDVPSTEVRFIQAQADVIVDQLNYGRWGANAREGMMLGKPVICRMDHKVPDGVRSSRALAECPLVHADEASGVRVLRDLLSNPDKRTAIGRASRAFALKWHAADAAAERFERIYDRLMAGRPLDDDLAFDLSRSDTPG